MDVFFPPLFPFLPPPLFFLFFSCRKAGRQKALLGLTAPPPVFTEHQRELAGLCACIGGGEKKRNPCIGPASCKGMGHPIMVPLPVWRGGVGQGGGQRPGSYLGVSPLTLSGASPLSPAPLPSPRERRAREQGSRAWTAQPNHPRAPPSPAHRSAASRPPLWSP